MQILFQKGCFYPRCLPSPVECTATRSAPPPEIYQWSHLTGDVTCGFNCNAVQQQEIYSDPRGSGRVKNVSVMVEDHHSRGRHWSIQLKWGSVWKHVLGEKKGTLTWIRTPPPHLLPLCSIPTQQEMCGLAQLLKSHSSVRRGRGSQVLIRRQLRFGT